MRLLLVSLVVSLVLLACVSESFGLGTDARPRHAHKKRFGGKASGPVAAPAAPGPVEAVKGGSPKRVEVKVPESVSKAMLSQLSDFQKALEAFLALKKQTKSIDRATLRKKFGDEVTVEVLQKAAADLTSDKKYFASVIPLDEKTSQLFLVTDKASEKAVAEVQAVVAKYKIPPTQVDLYYRGKEYEKLSFRAFIDQLGAVGTEMRGGQSAGAKDEPKGLGTMGAFLIDDNKRLYGMSNKHVFGANLGVSICQPAHQALYKANFDACIKAGTASATCKNNADTAVFPCNQLGVVSYASAAKDIALSTVTDGNKFKCAIHKGSAGTPVPITGSVNPAIGDKVWKYGSRTHFTGDGVITATANSKVIIKATSIPKFTDGNPTDFRGSYKNPANEHLFWMRTIVADEPITARGAMKAYALSQNKAFASVAEEDEVLMHMMDEDQILVFSAPGDSGSAIIKGDKVTALMHSGEWLKKECTLFDGWWSSIKKAGIEWCGLIDVTYALPIADVLADINSNTVFGTASAAHDGKIKQPVAVCKATDEASVIPPA